MTDRDRRRARLASLSDDELRAEALRVAGLEMRRKGQPFMSWEYMDTWYSCVDRGRPDLFHAAVAEARREREAQAAENIRRANELAARRKGEAS